MSSDSWPSPDSPPASLPRLEDLPISERGYDQEAVRAAFDSFYRHAAQLDVSLRALDAVEVFRRDADALRNDLRALRSVGFGGTGEPGWAQTTYERPKRDVPGVVFRLAAEVVLIIAVAVIAGLGHLEGWQIVALLGGAFVVVALCEWLAARARFVPPVVAFLPPPDDVGEPAPYVETPGPVWGAPTLGPGEDTQPDALTIVEVVEVESVVVESEDGHMAPEADPWEHGPLDDDSEPELAERGGFFRRRRK